MRRPISSPPSPSTPRKRLEDAKRVDAELNTDTDDDIIEETDSGRRYFIPRPPPKEEKREYKQGEVKFCHYIINCCATVPCSRRGRTMRKIKFNHMQL